MSNLYKQDTQESRIADLENQLQKQDKKIRLLGAIAATIHASPFDSPLKQFFDQADTFWTDVFEDTAACHNRCGEDLAREISACNGDKTCIAKAKMEAYACHQTCGDL